MPVEQQSRAKVGDLIRISGHRVGEKPRVGEILEVLGEPGHEHYRVRWDDGRESGSFYAGSDATLVHVEGHPERKHQ